MVNLGTDTADTVQHLFEVLKDLTQVVDHNPRTEEAVMTATMIVNCLQIDQLVMEIRRMQLVDQSVQALHGFLHQNDTLGGVN